MHSAPIRTCSRAAASGGASGARWINRAPRRLDDTNFLDTDGNPYPVAGTTTFNLYAQYRVKGTFMDGTRFRIGARNLFDKEPPVVADGYLGSLYVPYGRYWYLTVGKNF